MSSKWVFPGYSIGDAEVGSGFTSLSQMWRFPANNAEVLALNLKRRDVVALWRPSVYLVDPALVPTGPDLTYEITIEGRTFSTTQSVGASLVDIATALEAVLNQEQTIVKVFRSNESLLFYGALGVQLTVALNSNMALVTSLDPISVGEPGFMHVLSCRRHFTVEFGEVCEVEVLRCRRSISGAVNVEGSPMLISLTPLVDVSSKQVSTIVAREEFIP